MKRILIYFVLGISLSSALKAMQNNEPIVYPLNLTTALATKKATIYRNTIEYTLINNVKRTKTWGSPQLNNAQYSFDTQKSPAQYSVDAQIDTARTGRYHHYVYVNCAVNRAADAKSSDCIYAINEHFLYVPIGGIAYGTTTIETTDLGPLELTITVSNIDLSNDDLE